VVVEAVDERPLARDQIAADQPAVRGEGHPDEFEIVRIAGERQAPVLIPQRRLHANVVGDRIAHRLDRHRPWRRQIEGIRRCIGRRQA
jgi:hypothetical protein